MIWGNDPGNESVNQENDQQKFNSIYNTITVQMYNVDRGNNTNNKGCIGTSDENQCVPRKTTKQKTTMFRADNLPLIFLTFAIPGHRCYFYNFRRLYKLYLRQYYYHLVLHISPDNK